MKAASDPSFKPRPRIFDEFALTDRVSVITGANRGIGLDIALALGEAGSRAVYCIDIPDQPSEDWEISRDYIRKMDNGSRLEYVQADVRNQQEIWDKVEDIANKEGRMDVCVANAGILRFGTHCLDWTAEQFQEVMDVNTNGALFTAQAAGQQMKRFGQPGSIIMTASISGHIVNKGCEGLPYNTSKSAVLQMTRSMACELGPYNIRVNSISPGYILTKLTSMMLVDEPELVDSWAQSNPMGRIGSPRELRGLVTWLASDASSFCTGSDILITAGHHAW